MCEGARYEWEGRDAGIRTKLADGRRPLWRIVARGSAAREAARARLSARRQRYRDRGDRGGLARRSLCGADRADGPVDRPFPLLPVAGQAHPRRSEEHTSELQSLMRISYAVFCLKKTKIHKSSTT